MSGPFILPETQSFLDLVAAAQAPHMATLSAAEMREVYVKMGGGFDAPAEPDVTRLDFSHAGIPLRAYFPGADRSGPVIVYFHGGGWEIGDLETHDPACSLLAKLSGLRVVAVDYRMAPEHTYPASHDDCLAATRFVLGSPAELGGPVDGVAVAGDSAGGNLSFHVSSTLGRSQIIAQLLIYPAADCTSPEGGSYAEFAEGFVLDRRMMDRFIGDYVPNEADRAGRAMSPLLHEIGPDVPPAVILTAGLDPLRDQGRELAGRLAANGTDVHFIEAAGLIHGLATMRKAFPTGDAVMRRTYKAFADMIAAR